MRGRGSLNRYVAPKRAPLPVVNDDEENEPVANSMPTYNQNDDVGNYTLKPQVEEEQEEKPKKVSTFGAGRNSGQAQIDEKKEDKPPRGTTFGSGRGGLSATRSYGQNQSSESNQFGVGKLRSDLQNSQSTGANNVPLGAKDLNKLAEADGEKKNNSFVKGDRPRGYVPKTRTLDMILGEDDKCKDLYASIFEGDEAIEVKNLKSELAIVGDWRELNLHEKLLANIKRCGYLHPRRIQSYVIPLILSGHDVKAQAETGSGKSAAYLIPLIDMLAKENAKTPRIKNEGNMPRVIVVAPTRELVWQLFEQAKKLADETGVQIARAYGEYDYFQNSQEIIQGCDILVATPGRLLDFMNSILGLGRLKYFVIDEADRLSNESFSETFDKMIELPTFPRKENLQTLLFSATYPRVTMAWIDLILKQERVEVKNARANAPNSRILQTFEDASAANRISLLLKTCQSIIDDHKKKTGVLPRILAFVDKCQKADAYAFYLQHNGIKTLSLNSKRGQPAREKTLSEFRDNNVCVVVATDVCSRGLDIKDLDYVINVEMPDDFSTYVQRIGRTGRLKEGFAHSFVDLRKDSVILSEIANAMNREKQIVPEILQETQGFMPTKDAFVKKPPSGF